jgi:Uma2 family endonuclease
MQTNEPATARHRLIHINEFYRMAETGILKENERIELIEGKLLTMSPIGSFHAGLHTRLSRLLITTLNNKAIVSTQNPLYLSEVSSPEPDISLLKPRDDDYMHSLPTAKDVLLLIEIADSSLNYDLNTKLPLYAQYHIPEVWLIDIKQKKLQIYQKPSTDGYRLNFQPEMGEITHPLLLNDLALDWWSWFK